MTSDNRIGCSTKRAAIALQSETAAAHLIALAASIEGSDRPDKSRRPGPVPCSRNDGHEVTNSNSQCGEVGAAPMPP